MNLILFGFTRCGKTTYGKLLAENLQLPFVDIDEAIKKQSGMSCNNLVLTKGVQYFRSVESEIIFSLQGSPQRVIALGGGTVLSKENLHHLQKIGSLLYLKLDRETLFQRLSSPPFPYYIDPKNIRKSFQTIYCQRIPQYEKIPARVVDLEGRDREEILWQLIDLAISFV